MSAAYFMPKPTNTLSDYVIFIAFPLQQWWHEHISMINYTNTVRL